MNRETSLYLDFVRFSAAMVVMVGHLSGERFTGGLLWHFGKFMDDAVIVFFVLSGFVIAFVVNHKDVDLKGYAIARAARVYSVAIPALLITFTLDALGRHYAPELYTSSWGYHADNQTGQFLAGLFFVNQLWYAEIPTGSMLPYWSLGFEVWYYFFFAVIYFVRSSWKIPILFIACAAAGPRIVAFFPLWMMGYGAYHFAASNKPSRMLGCALLLSSLIAYAAYCLLFKDWLLTNQLLPASYGLPNFVPRYLVGTLFAAHLIGFVWASTLFGPVMQPFQRAIRWLAGATFTIYLFHIPVAQFLTTVLPWGPTDWRTRLVIFAGTFILMLLIAEFTERKKNVWHRWITNMSSLLKSRLWRPA